MKAKTLFLLLFIIAFSSVAGAQSAAVTITSKKVTYKRAKPLVDFKKSFTVNYPKVTAATPPALSKKIETEISYEKVLGFDLKDELGEYQWLEEADYEVIYNDKGFLTISLWMTGTGAYPSTSSKTVVVDLTTGTSVTPADVFTNLPELAAELKKQQTAEIAEAKTEIKKDPENTGVEPDILFENADFTAENINEFSINDEGVTFIYDYGFAHVARALEPGGRFSLTWSEIKPFIKKGGVFEKLVK